MDEYSSRPEKGYNQLCPLYSCLVRIEAICTRWKRFGTFSVQSSIVMRAMRFLGWGWSARRLAGVEKKETPADSRRPGSHGLRDRRPRL